MRRHAVAAATLTGLAACTLHTPDTTPARHAPMSKPRKHATAREARFLAAPRPAPTAASRSHERPPGPETVAGELADVTAYCATGNTTASGKWPAPGMVATLDRGIPFGTQVRIDGLGTFTVEDRIGYGSDFDVYLGGPGCEARAATFGRKRLRVEVIR